MVPITSGPTWQTFIRNPVFWLEFFVIAPHLPPYMTSEFHTYSFQNLVVYRAETIGALANSLRCYLIYRYLHDRYLHSIPKRRTIMALTDSNLGATYMFKLHTHGWTGAGIIIMLWGFCILICGYWYRAAEITACQLPSTVTTRCQEYRAQTWLLFGQETKHVNDVYIWDALWVCLVTSLTVGYGDVSPMTYYGRLVAVVSVFLGMALGAFLTASIVNILQWTPEEVTILRILERQNYRILLQKLAVDKIKIRVKQYIHRRRLRMESVFNKQAVHSEAEKTSMMSAARERVVNTANRALAMGDAMVHEANELTGRLRRLQFQLNQEDHTIMSDTFKVDLLHERVKLMSKSVETIYDKLSDPEILSAVIRLLEEDKDLLTRHRDNLHHYLDMEGINEEDMDHRTKRTDAAVLKATSFTSASIVNSFVVRKGRNLTASVRNMIASRAAGAEPPGSAGQMERRLQKDKKRSDPVNGVARPPVGRLSMPEKHLVRQLTEEGLRRKRTEAALGNVQELDQACVESLHVAREKREKWSFQLEDIIQRIKSSTEWRRSKRCVDGNRWSRLQGRAGEKQTVCSINTHMHAYTEHLNDHCV